VAAAGQLSIEQASASATLGNKLSSNYGTYLVDVYKALKQYGMDLHDESKSKREGAEAAFDAALLTHDLKQIADTAEADLAWAKSAATNLESFNQSSVSADADLLKKQATARYALDTGMSARVSLASCQCPNPMNRSTTDDLAG
jgi:hypothetical protein